jgi:hypothetical protein
VSYAIANVIYGTPITDAVLRKIAEAIVTEKLPEGFIRELTDHDTWEGLTGDQAFEFLQDSEMALFESLYTAGGEEIPRYLGVILCKFDEGSNTKLSDIQLAPTSHQYMEVRAKREKLPAIVLKHIPEPEVWFFWSSS